MDILLLNPFYSQPKSYYSFFRPAPPLGLMYIAGYLRKFGVSSKICELGVFDIQEAKDLGARIRFGFSDGQIADLIKKEQPKIVGITCMYSIYYRDVVEIAQAIKAVDPGVLIVLGGNHASTYWKHVLKNAAIDVVVCGEGEQTFLELATAYLRREDYRSFPGLAFRSNKGIVKNPGRDYLKDLDEIPFLPMDMIDVKRYIEHPNPFVMRKPGWGIVSSRGCPGCCVYCTVQAVWGRTWRGRSPKNVVDEIELLKKTYGFQEFYFLDDSASVDKKRWEGICDEILRRRLDITWTTPNGIAHWTLSREILSKMKKAGCYRVTFGIESGNPETRKFLGKPYPLEQAKELIRHANRIGMWTISTNIIGFPYESLGSIKDTVAFAKKSGTDFACFYLLIPQPTSAVYDFFKKEGLLNFDGFFESLDFDEAEFERINTILNETGCDTVYFKKEELSRLQKEAYRSFMLHRALTYLFNPLRLIRKIHSVEDLCYILRLLKLGAGIFARTLNPLHRKSSDYIYQESKITA
jgi:anaerobic magnesium-protoporphyrin IX monomethyl ester cyclase